MALAPVPAPLGNPIIIFTENFSKIGGIILLRAIT